MRDGGQGIGHGGGKWLNEMKYTGVATKYSKPPPATSAPVSVARCAMVSVCLHTSQNTTAASAYCSTTTRTR